MRVRCENCGEPALENDAVCWHCGQPLPGREKVAEPKVRLKESWQAGAAPETLIAYGALTVLVIIAALVVTLVLAGQPLVQLRLGTRIAPDWQQVVGTDNQFILSLPQNWRWIDGQDPEQVTALTTIMTANPIAAESTQPLNAEVDDLAPMLLAVSLPQNQTSTEQPNFEELFHLFTAEAGADPSFRPRPFLVVAQSRLLNQLTYAEAIEFFQNSDYPVSQVVFTDNFDKSHIKLTTLLEPGINGNQEYRCQQQFSLGQEKAIVVALCIPGNQFTQYQNEIEAILDSFQSLDS